MENVGQDFWLEEYLDTFFKICLACTIAYLIYLGAMILGALVLIAIFLPLLTMAGRKTYFLLRPKLKNTYFYFFPKRKAAYEAAQRAADKARSDLARRAAQEAERRNKELEEARLEKARIEFVESKLARAEAAARRDAWAREREEKRQKADFEKKIKENKRDAEVQDEHYTYEIGRHANETLAIRYGIANLSKETVPYYYNAKGGSKVHDPERDLTQWCDARTIRLKKKRKIDNNMYEVALSDFRDRKAIAIIEPGTEYVKTFYPLNKSWFQEHAELEEVLKGNSTMTLKELAHFHIVKAVKPGNG